MTQAEDTAEYCSRFHAPFGGKPITTALLNALVQAPKFAVSQKDMAMVLWSVSHPDAPARCYMKVKGANVTMMILEGCQIIKKVDDPDSGRRPARFRRVYYGFHPRVTADELLVISDWADALPTELIENATLFDADLGKEPKRRKSPEAPAAPKAPKPEKPVLKPVASDSAPLWQRMANSALATATLASKLNDLVNKVNESLGRPTAGLTCETGPLDQTINGALLAQRQALEVLELVSMSLSDAVKELAG